MKRAARLHALTGRPTQRRRHRQPPRRDREPVPGSHDRHPSRHRRAFHWRGPPTSGPRARRADVLQDRTDTSPEVDWHERGMALRRYYGPTTDHGGL